jgi:hypothetical protein
MRYALFIFFLDRKRLKWGEYFAIIPIIKNLKFSSAMIGNVGPTPQNHNALWAPITIGMTIYS